jgi:AraC-like DNA-binding protein
MLNRVGDVLYHHPHAHSSFDPLSALRSLVCRQVRRGPKSVGAEMLPDLLTTLDPALLRRLLRAKDRMDAASHEAWPVERLAKVGGVTSAHFARSFKAAFGLPPHRYLLTCRIEQASTLLRDTELSITEIAFATGWESLGSFGRTFRDVAGESPGALRRRARAENQQLAQIPACWLKAAQRPDLVSAVSEKRRRAALATKTASTTKEPR